jgi:hypothetical protein
MALLSTGLKPANSNAMEKISGSSSMAEAMPRLFGVAAHVSNVFFETTFSIGLSFDTPDSNYMEEISCYGSLLDAADFSIESSDTVAQTCSLAHLVKDEGCCDLFSKWLAGTLKNEVISASLTISSGSSIEMAWIMSEENISMSAFKLNCPSIIC